MIRKQRYPKLKQCRPFQHGFKVPLWTVNGMRSIPIQDVIGQLVLIRNFRGAVIGNPRIPRTCNAGLVEWNSFHKRQHTVLHVSLTASQEAHKPEPPGWDFQCEEKYNTS